MRHAHLIQAIALAALGIALPCPAVIVSTNPGNTNTIGVNTIAPVGLPEWNNVGLIGGGTGVYIGKNWVLTAEHVGASSFTLGATTYFADQAVRVTDSANNPTDLLLLHLMTTPTGVMNELWLNTSPLIAGEQFYNVGYGFERNTAIQYYNAAWGAVTDPNTATYAGFGYGASRADKTWGTNNIYNFGTQSSPQTLTSFNIGFGNVNAFAGEFLDGTDQIVPGDSGGAAFDSYGDLIGINDAMGTLPGQPGNTAIYGDGSYMVDISSYYADIFKVTGVPEPGSAFVVVIAIVALARRRNRVQG